MRSVRRLSVVLTMVVVVGCQNAPSPAPTSAAVAGPTPTPTPELSSQPSAAPSIPLPPSPPPPPPPTTSAEKIFAAEQSGAIDHEAAVLDRLFAVFGDPRLPDDLRGERSEDLAALDEARDALPGLSPAGQAVVRSYLVRPTHPESYWNQEPEAATATGARMSEATTTAAQAGRVRSKDGVAIPRPPAAPACASGWISTQVSPNIPVKIWSQCVIDPLDAQAAMEEARGYMASLWGPETSLMGVPPGDMNDPDDDWADTPETGDGLIDIYLLSGFSPSGHVRDFDVSGAYAVTASTPPIGGPAGALKTAAYIVVAPALRGLDLESTLAHEFFHVLQYWHNKQGLWDCVVGSQGSACTSDTPRASFWMVEATATWAEHRFVPAARATKDGPYDRFGAWRTTNMGLSQTAANNAYHSWLWPLFVQQQAGPGAIRSLWEAYEGKHGFAQLQGATNSVVPFDQQLREFAVRGWNELLNPGDPLVHHYFDASLDDKFPRDQPEGGRVLDPIDLDVDSPGPHTEYLIIDSLATRYQEISPSGDVHSIVLDFTALAPEIDVDGIVYLADGTWERRKLDGQVTWCLDKPADAVRTAYLVFANHDLDPGVLTRAWSWEAKPQGCGASEGTLTYGYLDTAPIVSQPGGSVSIDASVQVHLKINDGSQGFNAEFLNDGSTYGVTTHFRTVLFAGVDGCSPTATGTGTPGGALEIDSVVGNTWVDDDGRNRLTLAVDLPVHEEIESFWCSLGTSHESAESSVQFPSCDGTQAAETPTSRTYVFDCDFRGGSVTWTVSGSVIVER